MPYATALAAYNRFPADRKGSVSLRLALSNIPAPLAFARAIADELARKPLAL